MMNDIHKTPRLFTKHPLNANAKIQLQESQAHYLKNVLRLQEHSKIRLFNALDGEWIGTLSKLKKKSAQIVIQKQAKKQPQKTTECHLLFTPIKKTRMDFLIEKAVELDVTDLHPIITNRTENRNIKQKRIQSQIIEAAEQCERLTIPNFHPVRPLRDKITSWDSSKTILWAAERLSDIKNINKIAPASAFLIGPEGGFDEDEKDFLSRQAFVHPVSLGETILRTETAALYVLSCAKHARA